MGLLSIALTSIGLVLGCAVLWFCMQILFACLPRRNRHRPAWFDQGPASACNNTQVAVLIPAHNESIHLIPTLQSIQAQAVPGIRMLVVADNCTDDTATVARMHGAEVIERFNPRLRGKGYALDFGVGHLAGNPPDVVIVLDADCLLEAGALTELSKQAVRQQRPVQALYLMKHPASASVKARIAEFAWRVKNHARPRGLHWLGLPCQLTGSGMAFPWKVLAGVPLATGEIVEDMKLGLMLAERGHPPVFCEDAVVCSAFPTNLEAVKTQRTRWEHGHLAMIGREGLPKVMQGLLHANIRLFFLALDLCIPPLALLLMMTLAWLMLAAGFSAWQGQAHHLIAALCVVLVLAGTVWMAWWRFARQVVSGRELWMAPVYMVSKLSVYVGFLFRRQVDWVRSKRDSETK